MKLSKQTERKLKLENIERCLNCQEFLNCKICQKEDLTECAHKYTELPEEQQVVIISMDEWSKKRRVNFGEDES